MQVAKLVCLVVGLPKARPAFPQTRLTGYESCRWVVLGPMKRLAQVGQRHQLSAHIVGDLMRKRSKLVQAARPFPASLGRNDHGMPDHEIEQIERKGDIVSLILRKRNDLQLTNLFLERLEQISYSVGQAQSNH